jgi:hypothetical protein
MPTSPGILDGTNYYVLGVFDALLLLHECNNIQKPSSLVCAGKLKTQSQR